MNKSAIAYKYADPTEGARLVYDEADLQSIRHEDPSLLLGIDDRVEAGVGEDHDSGRVVWFDDETMAMVAWDSGVRTRCPIADLSRI